MRRRHLAGPARRRNRMMPGTYSVATVLPGALQRGDVVEQPVLGFAAAGRSAVLRRTTRSARSGRSRRPAAPRASRRADRCRRCGACAVGCGADTGQRRGLELDDLGLIDLVDHGARRPRQPVGAGVQPGGQDHRLPDAGARRQPGSSRRRTWCAPPFRRSWPARAPVRRPGTSARSSLAVEHPGEEVDADRADQRLGERVVDQLARVLGGHARAAATIVAVAPTLEARSQVSSSVRAIVLLAQSRRTDSRNRRRTRPASSSGSSKPLAAKASGVERTSTCQPCDAQIVAGGIAVAGVEQCGQVDRRTRAARPFGEPLRPSRRAAPSVSMCSVASRLPGADSAVMLSNSRSWASGGR